MSFEEYLEYEAHSRIPHEYLAGDIFAMSGVTPRHNRISGRLSSPKFLPGFGQLVVSRGGFFQHLVHEGELDLVSYRSH